jgi:hypothetical protein
MDDQQSDDIGPGDGFDTGMRAYRQATGKGDRVAGMGQGTSGRRAPAQTRSKLSR